MYIQPRKSSIRNFATRHRQRGLTLLELMIAAGMIAIITVVILGRSEMSNRTSVQQRIADDVSLIVGQVRVWRAARTNYTGLSLEVLTDMEMLDPNWGSGSGVNPVGGNYSATPGTGGATTFIVSVTGMTEAMCLSLMNQIETATLNQSGATCSSGTYTGTYR